MNFRMSRPKSSPFAAFRSTLESMFTTLNASLPRLKGFQRTSRAEGLQLWKRHIQLSAKLESRLGEVNRIPYSLVDHLGTGELKLLACLLTS